MFTSVNHITTFHGILDIKSAKLYCFLRQVISQKQRHPGFRSCATWRCAAPLAQWLPHHQNTAVYGQNNVICVSSGPVQAYKAPCTAAAWGRTANWGFLQQATSVCLSYDADPHCSRTRPV